MTDRVTALRDGLKAGLIAANTTASGRVVSEQSDPQYTSTQDAGGNLPKLCAYIPEVDSDSNAQGTSWTVTARFAVDVWTYGISTLSPPKTAEEVAADRRDVLVAQVIKAICGDLRLHRALGIKRVRRVMERRQVMTPPGEITYGAARITFDVDLYELDDITCQADPLEQIGAGIGVASADGVPSLAMEARPTQEAP